ncbi:MAG: hypothetical protein ACRCZD_16005, partial [Phycicoccus sp.]
MTTTLRPSSRGRPVPAAAAVLLAGALGLAAFAPAPAAAGVVPASTSAAASVTSASLPSSVSKDTTSSAAPGTPDLGRSVVVFDPSMPVAEIRAVFDRIYAQQVGDEMG